MAESDNYIAPLLRQIERYEFFGFKGHGDMLYGLANALEYMDAQAHSMQRARARASVADMRDLVIPIGKTLSDAKATIVAIVAERDELRKRVAELEKELKSRNEAYEELRWRSVEKSWSQPPPDRERDLRERLVESALRGVGCAMSIAISQSGAELHGCQAVWVVDGALAAMRKGEAHGK